MFRISAMALALTSSARAEDTRVMAASSLTDVLESCSQRFQQSGHPAPVFGFAASSKLVRQVQAGAPADLVLTADESWMQELERSGELHTSQPLLRNTLTVVVPRGGWRPQTLADLTDAKHVAIAGEAVPAGRRAREVLEKRGIELGGRVVVTPSVRGALGLAARAEVDAAIVYRSDALGSQRVESVLALDPRDHAPIVYPIALTERGAGRADARAFYDFLASPEAAAVFSEAGFETLVPASNSTFVPVQNHQGWHPILLSLWVGFCSLLLTLPPGIALGWLLARKEFFGKTLVTVMAMSPLVLPPVVTGFLLLRLFGRNGLFAPVLAPLGLEVAFTRWGAVIAAAVVGFPLLVQLVRQAIEAVDPRYEQMAQTLGRTPFRAFASVTLPLALPGIAAGAVLSFTRALGEFGATAVLAGDVPGETRTLALALFAHYETPGQEDAAMQLVWISLGLCAVSLAAYELLTRMQRRRLEI